MIEQISVFLENKKGRVRAMSETLANAGINLIALSIADTTNFGILRAIVSDTDKAVEILRGAGFTVNVTEVCALSVPDQPGGLAKVLRVLEEADMSIEYLYSFARKQDDNAFIIFRVEDLKKAHDALHAAGFSSLRSEDVYGK